MLHRISQTQIILLYTALNRVAKPQFQNKVGLNEVRAPLQDSSHSVISLFPTLPQPYAALLNKYMKIPQTQLPPSFTSFILY